MRALFVLILAILIGTPPAQAQAQLPAANGPFYRYIILIDGSSTMSRRKNAIAETVGRLIYGGFDGQIQSGDIFAIWTFRDEIDASSFPAQRWSSNNRQIVASNAVKYLTDFKYRKRSNLDIAVKEMIRATTISKEVTIFLISDGSDVIYGTPYDLDISTTYVLHRQKLAAAKQPFVTSITARDGRMQAWAVEAGDGDITVPRIPEKDSPEGRIGSENLSPQPKSEGQTHPPKTATPPKSTAALPPDKTKPPQEPVTATKPAPITHNNEPPRTIAQKPKVIQKPPPPPRTRPTVVKTTLPPTKNNTLTSTASPSVEPPSKPRESVKITTPRTNNNTSRANPRSAELTRSQGPSRQFPGTTPVPAVAPPVTTPAPVSVTKTPPVATPNATPSPSPPTTHPTTNSQPVVSTPTAIAAAPPLTPKTGSKPTTNSAISAPSAVSEPASATATNVVSSAGKPATTPDQKPTPAPTTPTAAPQAGFILPTEEPTSPTRYLFLALTLLAITGIMIFLALRRGRTPAQASLISQSLDRERN